MNWEREFFSLAASVLDLKRAGITGEPLAGGNVCSPLEVLIGELTYSAEMRLVLKDSGMLPAQRLARCAAGLIARQHKIPRYVNGSRSLSAPSRQA